MSLRKRHRRSQSVPVRRRVHLDETCTPFGTIQREVINGLLKNLELLRIRSTSGGEFIEYDFLGRNTSATVRDVLYCLFNAYDKKQAQKILKNVWPVKLGETEKEFREAILSWLSKLKDNHPEAAEIKAFHPRVLLQTGTPRCLLFLTELSTFVLANKLKEEMYLAGDAAPFGAFDFFTKKNNFTSIGLQAQQMSDEIQSIKIESHWVSLSSTLLRKSSLLAESEIPEDEQTKELELAHAYQSMKNEEAMADLKKAQGWLEVQVDVPDDLIRDFKKFRELCKHFFKRNGQTDADHSSLEHARREMQSANQFLEEISANRQALETMEADIEARLDEACKSYGLSLDEELSDTDTETSKSLQDLAGQLADALVCSDIPDAPEDM